MAVRSPLYDIFDPGGILRQQAEMGLLPQGDDDLESIGQQRAELSDLMPAEEQKSLLNDLAAAGSSGLAGLGWILDTPGAVVRGTLSGGIGKGLSALWETSDDRVDGRELLRQYGMAGDQDNWGNFTGGLAAEMLLDPLTYASFGLNQFLGKGAKTAAGQAVQKAGLLNDFGTYARNTLGMGEREALRKSTARSIIDAIPEGPAREAALRDFLGAGGTREMLDQPLAKMNRLSFPGFQDSATDLYGATVGDWAAKAGDRLGEGLMTNPYTGRAARELERAFNPDVLGFVDRDKQWDAKTIMAARRARERTDRFTLAGLEYDANQALRAAGSSLNDQDVSRAIRSYMENGEVSSEVAEYLELPAVQQLLGYADGIRETAKANAARLGLPLNEFQSHTGGGWFPRQQVTFDTPQSPEWPAGTTPTERAQRPYTKGSRAVSFDDNAGRGRDVAYDVMGQSDTINAMSEDAALQARLRDAPNEDAGRILEEWFAENGRVPTRREPMEEFLQAPDGYTRANPARPASESLYGWMDEVGEDGEFVHKAPPLPDTHPINRELRSIADQLQALRQGSADPAAMEALTARATELTASIPEAAREAWRQQNYTKLADFVRSLDPQHASRGVPVFGQNSYNELSRYVLGRGRAEVNAEEMLKILGREAQALPADVVVGGTNYTPLEALKILGLTGETAGDVLARTLGVDDISQVSFNKKFIDDWARVTDRGRLPPEVGALTEGWDAFTKRFKNLALLWPSRYTRDAYSGAYAAAMKGSFNPGDWRTGTKIGAGDYSDLLRRIKDLPRYRDLPTDEAKVRQFLIEAAAQGLGTSTASDELLTGAGRANMRSLIPGGAAPETETLASRARRASWKEWLNPFSLPTASGNANPILEAGDRAAQFTDAGNRYGTYLTQIRSGASPTEAARIANLTQVDYRPEAFTDFERDVLKRFAFPFYSYTKGITPLIADELVNNPAGMMGKTIRVMTRGSQPSEQNFTPEYLRQSASIPLPQGMPLLGLPADSNLRRYLTNIDLPFESAINIITPGTGNSILDRLGSGLRKTAMNVLGQSNPLIKGPLELATNRQFYSGRQLSDLYSMLEQPLGSPGRLMEQVIVNAPGGSRVLGTVRQLMDDRLSGTEKASKFLVNTLSGLKFQDVDMERTKRLAARDMLNQLLESTPGVRTYENITVPEDVLRTMKPEQQQQYLLYKIIQAEAAKRARQKKKQETALDPLQVLGVLQ